MQDTPLLHCGWQPCMLNSSALLPCMGLLLVWRRTGALTPWLWLTCLQQIVATSSILLWVSDISIAVCAAGQGPPTAWLTWSVWQQGRPATLSCWMQGRRWDFTTAVLPVRSLHLKVQQGRAARANMPRCFYAAVSGTDCMHAFV